MNCIWEILYNYFFYFLSVFYINFMLIFFPQHRFERTYFTQIVKQAASQLYCREQFNLGSQIPAAMNQLTIAIFSFYSLFFALSCVLEPKIVQIYRNACCFISVIAGLSAVQSSVWHQKSIDQQDQRSQTEIWDATNLLNHYTEPLSCILDDSDQSCDIAMSKWPFHQF